MDITVHCLDQNVVKNKGLHEAFPPICRSGCHVSYDNFYLFCLFKSGKVKVNEIGSSFNISSIHIFLVQSTHGASRTPATLTDDMQISIM